MTVSTPVQPDFTSQSGTTYKTSIDDAVAVAKRFGWWFAAHEESTPGMTVRLEAGHLLDGTTLTEVAAQSTGTITAPTTNNRIDRVVVDESTGSVSVITGSESATPSAPAITAGKLPVAQVLLTPSTTQIENPDITDERAFVGGGGTVAWAQLGFMSASGAAQEDFETSVDSYDLIRISGWVEPQSSVALQILLKANGSYQTGSSYDHTVIEAQNSGPTQDLATTTAGVLMSASGAGGRRGFLNLIMGNHRATGGSADNSSAFIDFSFSYQTGTNNEQYHVGRIAAHHTDILNNAVDGIRIKGASGNIDMQALVEGAMIS